MSKNYTFKSENHSINSEDIEAIDTFQVLSSDGNDWVVQFKNKIHKCKIVSFDSQTKEYQIEIDHQLLYFTLQDEVDRRVEAMGMNEVIKPILDQLKAPMPGLVINIEVNAGDEVEEGDTLLVLEAMKMENVIKAVGSGTVKEIKVEKGDKVDKDQILIQF